jgi:hypothetical protein
MKALLAIALILLGTSTAAFADSDFLAQATIQIDNPHSSEVLNRLVANPKAVFEHYQPALDSGSTIVRPLQVTGSAKVNKLAATEPSSSWPIFRARVISCGIPTIVLTLRFVTKRTRMARAPSTAAPAVIMLAPIRRASLRSRFSRCSSFRCSRLYRPCNQY